MPPFEDQITTSSNCKLGESVRSGGVISAGGGGGGGGGGGKLRGRESR